MQAKFHVDWPLRGLSCGTPVVCKLAYGGMGGAQQAINPPSPIQEAISMSFHAINHKSCLSCSLLWWCSRKPAHGLCSTEPAHRLSRGALFQVASRPVHEGSHPVHLGCLIWQRLLYENATCFSCSPRWHVQELHIPRSSQALHKQQATLACQSPHCHSLSSMLPCITVP